MRAVDPEEQLLLTLNTGTPVRPRPERERGGGLDRGVNLHIVRLRHEERGLIMPDLREVLIHLL